MPLDEWEKLFALSEKHGFVIASDECYSEIYFRDEPPLGGLEAATKLGRGDFKNLIALTGILIFTLPIVMSVVLALGRINRYRQEELQEHLKDYPWSPLNKP